MNNITKEEALKALNIISNYAHGEYPQEDSNYSKKAFKSYFVVKSYIQNSKSITPSIKWEEIGEEFYRMNIAANLTFNEIVDFFKPHFLSLQQQIEKMKSDFHKEQCLAMEEYGKVLARAEKAEREIKELKEQLRRQS